MPSAWVAEEDVVLRHRGVQWSDEDIELLAHRYRVSREAMVRRLLVLGKTNESFYRRKRRELQAEFEAQLDKAQQRRDLGLGEKWFCAA